MKWMSFAVGDVVSLVAKAGDQLWTIRTATGDFGLAIVRQNELVVAIGAVTEVNLGGAIVVSNGLDCLQVSIGGHMTALRSRESVSAAGGESGRYDIYVERTFESGLPGVAECASIIRTGRGKMTNAAMRGAVLLANEHGDTLKGELWNGSYLRS